MKKTAGSRRAQGRSALAAEQVSGKPAADLRADGRGGVEPAVREPADDTAENRRRAIKRTGDSLRQCFGI